MSYPLSKEEFDFIYSRVPRLCVDLVVKNNDGVLLTYRTIDPANIWHLPGGSVFFNESLEEAIKRIAQKELGVKVRIEGLLDTIDCYQEPLLPDQHPISVVYEVSIEEGEIKLNEEASKFGFFKEPPKDTPKIHADFVRKLLS